MNQKSISKKITYVILAVLFLEVLTFAGWYFTQPTYKTTIFSIVKDHESSNHDYFFQSQTNQLPSIDSTYYALSIYSNLNETITNKEALSSFILRSYNSTTGLFSNNNVSSIETTFKAVSALTILGKTAELNKTQMIQAILALKTSDSLFREYNEFNTSKQLLVGELDHLYEALSTLNILYNNTTLLFNNININNTIKTVTSLQGLDGGMYEGILYSIPNMKNAYYTMKVFNLLNKSLSYYESLGFNPSSLENWMQSMYSSNGFKMQSDSEPTVEATSYALVAYKELGMTNQEIENKFPEAITSITNFLGSDFTNDHSRNPLDVLNDLMDAMGHIGQQSKLTQPYFNESAQLYFGGAFAITILAFVINTVINLLFALKEDDTKYFEGSLHIAIQKIIENESSDYTELSTLLGELITSIELMPLEGDDKLGILKAYSSEVYFLITYETFNDLAKKVEKYSSENNDLLSVIDFLESDIFFTVAEGREHLQANVITE